MSNIDLVLLGLIKQKSQSAYDIKKNIEYRNIPRWVRISEQSIYKKVLQLESKEYIVSHKEKEGNMPDKAVYTITDKGNDYFNRLMNDISNYDVSLYGPMSRKRTNKNERFCKLSGWQRIDPFV